MSLLDKALSHKKGKRKPAKASKEEKELAMAWAMDEVSIVQVGIALNMHTGSAYTKMAFILKEIVAETMK